MGKFLYLKIKMGKKFNFLDFFFQNVDSISNLEMRDMDYNIMLFDYRKLVIGTFF